ncbi:SDR family NAD(P)-dependent oxidoreductase [Nocardia thraciensis]
MSSFGISGTNAHVILEEPPAETISSDPRTPVVPWVVTARSERALAAQIGRLREWLRARPEVSAADVGMTLAKRSAFRYRATAVGTDPSALIAGLTDTEPRTAGTGKTVFVFPGQGAQYSEMGRQLYDEFPVFAETVGKICDPAWLFDTGTDLDATENTQWALFAVGVGLFRLLETWGVTPDLVLGHSIGEVAAAHVAGVLSLDGALRVVRVRSRLMGGLPAGGAMVAVAIEAAELAELPPEVSVAAVNAPAALVVSGPAAAVEAVAATYSERGHKVSRLRVSHAFHSALMDPILPGVAAELADIEFRAPGIPLISTVTGKVADDGYGSADYWTRQIREPVRFADAVATALAAGASRFVELGPGASASAMVAENLGARAAIAAPLLRAGDGERRSVLAGLGRLFEAGVSVDWARTFVGSCARHLDLPSYAFERERYWMPATPGDSVAAGLVRVDHPILAAATQEPDSGGVRFSGRLSLATTPWLADHRVAGEVVVPAAALVELAIHAGDEIGCGLLDELTLRVPLVVSGTSGVVVHVHVGAVGEAGRRPVAIYARQQSDSARWTLHAEGVMAPPEVVVHTTGPEAWPPPDAAEVDPRAGYERSTGAGYGYGPAFRGVRRLWRDGETWFAEIILPEIVDEARFGIHPALLDAVVHARVLAIDDAATDAVLLPFVWEGTRLWATGARHVRVHGRPSGPDGGETIEVFDAAGRAVVSVRRLVARPVALAGQRGETTIESPRLRLVHAIPIAAPASEPSVERAVDVLDLAAALAVIAGSGRAPESMVVDCGEVTADSDVPSAVATTLDGMLALLQGFFGAQRFEQTRLVVLSRGLSGGAVRGLVRTAQAEEPGRVVLVDVRGGLGDVSIAALTQLNEPEIIVDDGVLSVPRLGPADPDSAAPDTAPAPDPNGTVLITGGTGGLGVELARHLVTAYGFRRLTVTGRRGSRAPGARRLHRELTELGAQVDIVACDITDRAAVAELLDGIPTEHPLTAVVHAAGVLDDGILAGLTSDRLRHVLAPKVDGAWHLHELTRAANPEWFVLFSSLAGTIGTAGQANYAAANGFLDTLAEHRREQGLPAVSIDWALWAAESGMGGTLGEADSARIERSGLRPLTAAAALALFDAAVGQPEPVVVAADFDRAALRAAGRTRRLSPILTDLVGIRPTAAAGPAATRELDDLTPDQQRKRLLETVRSQIALVLGHRGPERIDTDANFRDLGFDSLAAIELRNVLGATTGVRLPATAVFDHPTPAAIAAYLHRQLYASDADTVFTELARLEARLGSLGSDDAAVAQVLTRLEALTRTCRELTTTAAPAGSDNDLRTATAAELVEMIQQEFGAS